MKKICRGKSYLTKFCFLLKFIMHKSQTDDYRFIMFVKLFFGMGFLWIFEIIAAICANDDNDDGYFW